MKHANETDITLLEDGRLLALLRIWSNYSGAGSKPWTFYSHSADGGRTWTKPKKLNIFAQNLNAWYTAEGTLVAACRGIDGSGVFYASRLSDQERLEPTGPDVLFLGALYGEGVFPEAEFRRDCVVAMSQADGIELHLFGRGWPNVGLQVPSTLEQHGSNAELMAKSKMTLSVSQASDLWGYTSDRLYNITATGCPALVQRFAGMEQHGYKDGETCIAFETIPEMVDKAITLSHEKYCSVSATVKGVAELTTEFEILPDRP